MNTNWSILSRNDLERRAFQITESFFENLGYRLIMVLHQGNLLSYRIEPLSQDVTLGSKDTLSIAKQLRNFLRVEASNLEGFGVEISSAGMDRFLTHRSDFDTYLGCSVRLQGEALGPLSSKRLQGKIEQVLDEGFELRDEMTGELVFCPHQSVHRAQLVVTDEVLRLAMKRGSRSK